MDPLCWNRSRISFRIYFREVLSRSGDVLVVHEGGPLRARKRSAMRGDVNQLAFCRRKYRIFHLPLTRTQGRRFVSTSTLHPLRQPAKSLERTHPAATSTAQTRSAPPWPPSRSAPLPQVWIISSEQPGRGGCNEMQSARARRTERLMPARAQYTHHCWPHCAASGCGPLQ